MRWEKYVVPVGMVLAVCAILLLVIIDLTNLPVGFAYGPILLLEAGCSSPFVAKIIRDRAAGKEDNPSQEAILNNSIG